jgi:Holliday junction resolvasome RuvABC endonuclease subunit
VPRRSAPRRRLDPSPGRRAVAGRARRLAAAHCYGAFLGYLTAWAEARQIPYAGVPVGTIKRHVTGRGNADKAAVIAAVRVLGFDPADDNEADALALLDWALKNGGRR